MATYNPFRYRGYRYDGDTGLYYLQSRYYDPMTCRFVNADRYAEYRTRG
ncbi:MAG: RHS repeat-associated core domain-containing protein [Oscillospiraceae bacterium]